MPDHDKHRHVDLVSVSNLQSMISSFPDRRSEIVKLHYLLKCARAPFVLITGVHGTGKSSIARQLMVNSFCSDDYCWLDCAEFSSTRLIYGSILSKLFHPDVHRSNDGELSPRLKNDKISSCQDEAQPTSPTVKRLRKSARSANGLPLTNESKEESEMNIESFSPEKPQNESHKAQRPSNFFNCNHHLEFIEMLNELLDELAPPSKKTAPHKFSIVLDNADYLIQFDNLLAVLTRLNEFSLVPVQFSVVLISTHSFEYFRQVPGLVTNPLIVPFCSYSEKTLLRLIVDTRPSNFGKQLYEKWVSMVLASLYLVSRNFEQLRYICENQFLECSSKIAPEATFGQQVQQLWAEFESKHLKLSLQSFSIVTENPIVLCDELPVCAKYILIASYCASYNSVKSDKRFFLKMYDNTAGSRHVRKKALTKLDQISKGPKAFTLERLLHIYKALQELNEGHEFDPMLQKETTSHLMSQIMTFVAQKLLVKVNSITNSFAFSSLSKYRIADCITFEFINGISSSVNLDLKEHLEQNLIKQ